MAKAKKGRPVACIASGYRYEFTGKSRWRGSRDELWDTEVGGKTCGRVVGTRRIDGAPVTVIKRGAKFYAATGHLRRRKL